MSLLSKLSVGSVVLRSTITFSPFSFSDMYTLWGGDNDDDDDDDDDDDVHLVGRPLAPAVVIVGTVSSREDLGVHPA